MKTSQKLNALIIFSYKENGMIISGRGLVAKQSHLFDLFDLKSIFVASLIESFGQNYPEVSLQFLMCTSFTLVISVHQKSSKHTSFLTSEYLPGFVDRRQMALWTVSAWPLHALSTAGALCWLWAATMVASSSGTFSREESPKSSARTSTQSALYGETHHTLCIFGHHC